MKIEIRLSDPYTNLMYVRIATEQSYLELFLDQQQLQSLIEQLEHSKELFK
jgi:hypothetical protein